MDGGAWWAAVHGVAKSRTGLSDFTFTFHFHAGEKVMATHSSVLAWRIPGMGEPGGLLSMGLHRVGHDWSDLAAAAAAEVLYQVPRCLLEIFIKLHLTQNFPGGSVVKNLPANAGDAGDVCSIPGSGRFPGGGNGYPLQYSCLENLIGRVALCATVLRVTKSWAWLNVWAHTRSFNLH